MSMMYILACSSYAGSALTTFNKGGCNLNPKIIAHRSSATRGEMLVNSRSYRQFCHKAKINDNVSAFPSHCGPCLLTPECSLFLLRL